MDKEDIQKITTAPYEFRAGRTHGSEKINPGIFSHLKPEGNWEVI